MALPTMVVFDGFVQGLHKPILNICSQVIADSWMVSDNFLFCLSFSSATECPSVCRYVCVIVYIII